MSTEGLALMDGCIKGKSQKPQYHWEGSKESRYFVGSFVWGYQNVDGWKGNVINAMCINTLFL